MRALLIAGALLAACTGSGPVEPPPTSARADDPPPVVETDDGPPPSDPSHAVMQKVCAHPCARGLATVRVFRDAQGKAARIRLDGDLENCSHPPRIYYDAQGNETLTIANEPVSAGSPEAAELARRQAAEIEGLVEAEPLGCADPAMCEPARTEGFRSDYPCRTGDDCVDCQCRPVDRATWMARGGADGCIDRDAECTATNPVCCDGRCMLAR